jgi:hypothetical protein
MLNVIDRPTSECQPDRIHIGPTAVDFSMIAKPIVTAKETAMLKSWKRQDLASHYRAQRANRYR